MKRFISIIALLSLVIPNIHSAVAASEYDSSENIAFSLIGTVGTGSSYDIAPGDVFTIGSNFGQNMYQLMYERAKHQTSDLAMKKFAETQSYSVDETKAIVTGGNIAEVLGKKTGEQLSPEQATVRRQEVLRQLADEKNLADLQIETMMEVQPTELFADGDESNSGFDLITDLKLIDKIIFGGDQETNFGNTGPGSLPGTNVIDLGGGGGDGTGNNGQGQAGGGSSQTSTPSSSAADQALDDLICPVDGSFNDAVEKEREKEKKAGNAGGGNSGNNGGGGAGNASGDKTNGDEPLVSEKAADWSRPRVCTDVFCLKVEAVYKKESSYQATDNCIACHFEKINESFKKTLDRNVTPNKQTGNISEGPKCKRTMLNLKWNLILISQPILTPPNDDLVIEGDFVKNMKAFYARYYGNPGRCPKDKPGPCKPDPDPVQQATESVLNGIDTSSDQSKVLQDIRQQVAAKQAEATKLMSQFRLESNAIDQASQFQVLLQEMDTMNLYFESFNKLFESLISTEGDSACKILQDKPQCT